MTRNSKPHVTGHWSLQSAKARFSELVRRVHSDGPQHVTVHGRDEVVVITADAFRGLQRQTTGDALIVAMQASPHREVETGSSSPVDCFRLTRNVWSSLKNWSAATRVEG